MTRLFSAAVSLVALAAWLVASNHCALASILPAPDESLSEHSHCAGAQEAPTEEEQGGECDGSKCCKSLSAPTLGLAKNVVNYDSASFVAVDFLSSYFRTFGAPHGVPTGELDTGPPETQSFAESVLQRSLLAHAPPFSV